MVLVVAVTSGCAQHRWQKYGATQSEFNNDTYECQTEAARTYPAQMVTEQITSGYTTPSNTNCYGNSKNINCTTTGGQYVPGVTSPVDVNANNRLQAAKQCMYARGWQLVRVK